MSIRSFKKQLLLFAIPILCGTSLSLILFRLAIDSDLWAVWSGWLPYARGPIFGDLSITQQHLREAAAGLDPLGDPTSQYAYPRVLLAFHNLGLQYIPPHWAGLIQSIVVVAGIVFVLRPDTLVRSFANALLFISPPILLGFERANLDFPLFLLCAACASAWARAQTSVSLAIPVAGVVLAAALKLHPVFAMFGAVVVETGKRRLVWLTGLALLFAYWTYHRADFGLIAPKLPLSMWGSWGCLLFFVGLDRFFTERDSYDWLVNAEWRLIAVVTYGVLAVAACAVGMRLSRRFAMVTWQPRECAYYWMGAAICCGSFAGANIAYRWIFVLLAVPLLVRVAQVSERTVARWAQLTLAAIALSLIVPLRVNREMFVIIQFVNWSCILLLIVGGAALRSAAYPQILAQNVRAGRPQTRSSVDVTESKEHYATEK